MYANENGGRGINVVYWDGHVEWHNAAQAQAIIAQAQAAQAKSSAPSAEQTVASPEKDGGTLP